MAKMKTRKRTSARRKAAAKTAGDRIRDTWAATLAALASAETEVEKQVRLLLKKNRINAKDARAALEGLRDRFDRERKKAIKQLEARLKGLQSRIRKERKNVTKMAEEGVQSALAALNIPSRQEVADLTGKVEQLSRKIDSIRRK
jgi:poly(hydroxyalkanoate) granule-associated protein